MIFSTITQNNLNLTADTTEIPAQYSNNIQFKFIQDSERFSGYIPTIYIGVYDSAMIECSDVINAGGAVVVDGDGVFAISNEIMYRNGFLAVGVTLTNNDENVSLKPVIYRIQASVGGLSPLPPDEGEWQQVVKAFVETLFNNWSTENLDPIKAQLEELISTAQTQQEKITSQQTQIDNAIGNMGDYEIVQEDPVQIRFKKGDGTFGETVDLGDGLASKAMVNAGYYTYKGISYGGSASNNGIDVAEIDGAYSQETTNGYQLFDASKLPTKSQGGATVTNNGDGSFTISGSGTLSEDFSIAYSATNMVNYLKQGNIILDCVNTSYPYVEIQLKKEDNSNLIVLTNRSNAENSANITQEILSQISKIRVYIYGVKDGVIGGGIIKPMLYQDGDGTFESFTGGVASPNPEYPQEPKFVGDYNEDMQKYDIDFMTSGKNLFDNKAIQRTWQCDYISKDDGSIEITPTATTGVSYTASEVIELLVGKTYSLQSFENNEYFKNMVIWKANTTITAYKTQELFTVEEGNNLIQIGIYINNGSLSNKASLKPQLSLGEPKSEFVPFQGFETTTVELNQPLRELPNGVKDTIENGVVTRRVGCVDLGDFDYTDYSNYNGYYTTVGNLKSDNYGEAICTHFKVIKSHGEMGIRIGAGNSNIYIEQVSSVYPTASEFKSAMSGVKLFYELATSTTEQITLPTLPSWYPYTNALVGTELQPSFVEWHIKTAGANQNDLTVIKEDISQLQTETTHLNDDVTRLRGAFTSVTDLTKQLFLLMHRVGDIIFSTSDENPSTIYGGTWVAWGKGQVPVGVDTSDSDFNTVEKTGGEKEHTLTVDEMPSHKHDFGQQFATTSNLSGAYGYYMIAGTQTDVIKNTGGNQPHNNLQPYITCYMWKRTA